jgi:Beta-lactamase
VIMMSNKSPLQLSRRDALAGLAFAAACWTGGTKSASAEQPRNAALAANCKGPIFTATGPDAALYGAADGYPVPGVELARRHGNPWEPKYRVGAFSHIDEIYPTRQINRAATPWTFKCSPANVLYEFRGNSFSFADYMSRKPITGLLVCKDDQILFENYQYNRTDHDRLVSQSMVKSIVGILIGIAFSEGAIRSVDDRAEAYVPGLKGTEYGATSIRDLLHMSSGVDFGEDRDHGHDLNQLWKDMVTGPGFLGSGLFKRGQSAASHNSIIA